MRSKLEHDRELMFESFHPQILTCALLGLMKEHFTTHYFLHYFVVCTLALLVFLIKLC